MVGFLEITFGCMFSGKSNHLVECINNFITFNQLHKNQTPKVLIITSQKDDREELNKINNLTTHNKYKNYKFPINVENISIDKLENLQEENIKNYDYIAIDESQFFEDLQKFVDRCLALDKYIHCAGLLSDSEKKAFGQMYLLIPYADKVNQLKAFCVYCRHWEKNAVFTKWIGDQKKGLQIDVGAENKYVPVCGKHYKN